MSYAIIGFGKIGQALAQAFARRNIEVTVASRRPAEALAPQAEAIGPTVVARSLQDAVQADTILLAMPFGEHPAVAKALPSWEGKTIIDATNLYPVLTSRMACLGPRLSPGRSPGPGSSKASITWVRPPWPPTRSSRVATGSSFRRATTRTRSRLSRR